MIGRIYNCIFEIIKPITLFIFSKKNKIEIHSNRASLKAHYGYRVSVAEGTYISDDVIIGDHSYINANSSVEHAIIGKYCSISSGVYIAPFEHALSHRSTHPVAHDTTRITPTVTIGNDVLISLNVVIKEGITIGDGAVIGAGAVVTHDVKPYEVVGGIPARHIKYRFSEKQIEELLNIKWWDWDEKKIALNIDWLKNNIDTVVEV